MKIKITVLASVCFTIIFFQSSFAQDATQTAFSKSYDLEKSADYNGAINQLKSVYDEKSYVINLRLGWLCYEAGQYTESMSYYQKAIDLMPYAIEAKFGFTYPAAAAGDMDKVSAQYQNILNIDPQNTQANYRMGAIAYGKKDYATAQKYLEKVVNLYPFDYDSNLLLAWVDLKEQKFADAKLLFNIVLLYSPNDKSALEGLGEIK